MTPVTMPLHELLQNERSQIRLGAIDLNPSWTDLAVAGGNVLSGAHLARLARTRPAFTTEWGTTAWTPDMVSPATAVSIAWALDMPAFTILRHSAVSAGIPGAFDHPGDEMIARLPQGWQHMDAATFGLWRRIGGMLLAGGTAAEEIARRDTLIADLRAELDAAKAQAKPRTRTPATKRVSSR
jgi:hypothetical protein